MQSTVCFQLFELSSTHNAVTARGGSVGIAPVIFNLNTNTEK